MHPPGVGEVQGLYNARVVWAGAAAALLLELGSIHTTNDRRALLLVEISIAD